MNHFLIAAVMFAFGLSVGRYLNTNTSFVSEPKKSSHSSKSTEDIVLLTISLERCEKQMAGCAAIQSSPTIKPVLKQDNNEKDVMASGGEASASLFVKKILDSQVSFSARNSDQEKIYWEIMKDNNYLVSVAFDKNLPDFALKRYLENLTKLPNNMNTLGRIVQVLNKKKSYDEALSYCEMGIANINGPTSQEMFRLAANCADSYFLSDKFNEALKWHMYCFEYGKVEKNSYLQEIHSYQLALAFEKINDQKASEKYMKIACDFGENRACVLQSH